VHSLKKGGETECDYSNDGELAHSCVAVDALCAGYCILTAQWLSGIVVLLAQREFLNWLHSIGQGASENIDEQTLQSEAEVVLLYPRWLRVSVMFPPVFAKCSKHIGNCSSRVLFEHLAASFRVRLACWNVCFC
jgi:hypothetical protein